MIRTITHFIALITYFLILSFFVTINSALADIMMISDFIPLKKLLEEADQDTLVIFDVDHVLIMPTDEYTLNRHPYRKELWKEIEGRLSKEEMKTLYGLTASKAKWRLVDPDIIDIFTRLKERQIPSIALTSIYTGKFGNIEKLEDWRIKHLHDLGFDFVNLTPIKEEILLYELEEQDGVPMLKSGVILTAQIDKGKTLEYILRHNNYYPKTIIFIDDMLNNLESLERLSSKLKIKFHGLHYTAVSNMPIPVINKQIEKLRFQILEKEHKWLNHQELAERNSILAE
jgi:hydroxymethylpyrimidine pyrophosphatase-like HAD family hydrolase